MHLNVLNGPAYHEICPLLKAKNQLHFKHYEYFMPLKGVDKLNFVRNIHTHILVFLLKGELHINWGEYRDVVVKAGEMYFLPKGAHISGYIKEDVNFVMAIINRGLTKKELEDLRAMKNHEDFEKYKFKPMTMHPQMVRLAESVRDYLANDVDCPHLHEAKFNELYVILHWYYSLADNAQLFYSMTGNLSEFRTFILDNFRISISIDELVEKSNMSRSTFDRKFKEAFDVTPLKWIEEHTRQKIINMSSTPGITAKDIMYEIGIYSPSQFTQLCKRLCGTTPSNLIRNR